MVGSLVFAPGHLSKLAAQYWPSGQQTKPEWGQHPPGHIGPSHLTSDFFVAKSISLLILIADEGQNSRTEAQ